MDYSGWTLAALQAEFVRLGTAIVPLANDRQAISEELDRRRRMAEARVRLGSASAQEVEALKDVLLRG